MCLACCSLQEGGREQERLSGRENGNSNNSNQSIFDKASKTKYCCLGMSNKDKCAFSNIWRSSPSSQESRGICFPIGSNIYAYVFHPFNIRFSLSLYKARTSYRNCRRKATILEREGWFRREEYAGTVGRLIS